MDGKKSMLSMYGSDNATALKPTSIGAALEALRAQLEAEANAARDRMGNIELAAVEYREAVEARVVAGLYARLGLGPAPSDDACARAARAIYDQVRQLPELADVVAAEGARAPLPAREEPPAPTCELSDDEDVVETEPARPSLPEQTPEQTPEQRWPGVRSFVAGRSVALCGGVPVPDKTAWFQGMLGAESSLEWLQLSSGKDEAARSFARGIENSRYAAVFVLERTTSHVMTGLVKNACDTSGTFFRMVGTAGQGRLAQALDEFEAFLGNVRAPRAGGIR